MSRTGKIGLVVLAALLLLAGLTFWGWSLWKGNQQELLKAAEESKSLGREEGRGLDERECLAAALARGRKLPGRAIQESVLNNLRLRGCLETSRFVADFCDEVPFLEDQDASAAWQMSRAIQEGVSSRRSLFDQFQRYCFSQERQRKESP